MQRFTLVWYTGSDTTEVVCVHVCVHVGVCISHEISTFLQQQHQKK